MAHLDNRNKVVREKLPGIADEHQAKGHFLTGLVVGALITRRLKHIRARHLGVFAEVLFIRKRRWLKSKSVGALAG
jgi:hypothetical protein